MDEGAWQATVYRVTKSQTQLKQLNACTHTHILIISISQMKAGRHKEVRWALQGSHPPSATNTHWKEV